MVPLFDLGQQKSHRDLFDLGRKLPLHPVGWVDVFRCFLVCSVLCAEVELTVSVSLLLLLRVRTLCVLQLLILVCPCKFGFQHRSVPVT